MRVRLIGYWRDDNDESWPDPRDLIDEAWDSRERDSVALYLSNGLLSPWIQMGISLCRLCGKPNGSQEFTDGVYLWPEGLAHYVDDHSVKLPGEVLSHIRRRCQEMGSLEVDKDWWREIGRA